MRIRHLLNDLAHPAPFGNFRKCHFRTKPGSRLDLATRIQGHYDLPLSANTKVVHYILDAKHNTWAVYRAARLIWVVMFWWTFTDTVLPHLCYSLNFVFNILNKVKWIVVFIKRTSFVVGGGFLDRRLWQRLFAQWGHPVSPVVPCRSFRLLVGDPLSAQTDYHAVFEV